MLRAFLLATVVASSSAFLDIMSIPNKNCTDNEYGCLNGQCIPKEKRCDAHYDCADKSDESDCDVVLCKLPYFFRCNNSRCISSLFMCDGDNDCEDFSDEVNCKDFGLFPKKKCLEGHWQCQDMMCIPNEWVCNKEVDCLDGSDETVGCTADMPCEGFKCKNKQCVPNEWRCDGVDDCNDKSDELDCDKMIKPENCTLDKDRFLCFDNVTCIELDEVCSGKSECPDGSDEHDLCSMSAAPCVECSHRCVHLPNRGPTCICPTGYHTLDEKNCQDVNECETYGICDQKCQNLAGSYKCSCDPKYTLQSDKKTCKAVGEATLVFSSKTDVRSLTLPAELYSLVARNLKQVVGVAYDGDYVYWTDIFSEHESIIRATPDGSRKDLVISSGLGAPEDLAVDWLTGNIYFTDAERQHIGVCTNSGLHCMVIVNKDVHKPRGIVLNVAEGEMYWTDWGRVPEIARAKMDGSQDVAFVSDNIKWPNGLAIDHPNKRLYWADAKLMTLESINLDGTGRMKVVVGVSRHPYAVAIFENRLYWSDWSTRSIESCDKFTGKNHHTLVKENEQIYGISVYHPSMKTRTDNPCASAGCSDICLLNGQSYTCGCPQNKELTSDRRTCKEIEKRQTLVLGTGNVLVHVEHQLLGKHDISALPIMVKDVGALAYDSMNNRLFVADNEIKDIIQVDLTSGIAKPLNMKNLGEVVSMDFDYMGNNLFWCDITRGTVELINMNSATRRPILYDMAGEVPESIALVPEESVMFVAFKKRSEEISHIDKLLMDGSSRTHVVDHGLLGPVSLMYDKDLNMIFIADAGTANIESITVEGHDRHGFRSLQTSPVSITSLKQDLFWVNENSHRLYWANKWNSSITLNKKITLDLPQNLEKIKILSVTPHSVPATQCHHNNGNCSDICMMIHKVPVCMCPIGRELKADNRTCAEPTKCDFNKQFLCKMSKTCIPKAKRCDGKPDCPNGEDEDRCRIPTFCATGKFRCNSGQCIDQGLVCNYHFDCADKSDEHNCTHLAGHRCQPNHFLCGDGQCLSERFVCDGNKDCKDGEDETNCILSTCEAGQFRCNSGTCIPKYWECDKEYDCVDLSDEHSGCASEVCPPHAFRCTNGKCIGQIFVCDESDDCGDNSDELHCESNNKCSADEFMCTSNTSICLHSSARCNGTSECPHQEDEAGCTECHVEEFTCSNKKCIPSQWICDHTNDCGDGSDESPDLCFHILHGMPVDAKDVSCVGGFRCKSGSCVDYSSVCDGTCNCYDCSEEGGSCSSSCGQYNNPCSDICISTPSGPVCGCRPGYKLLGDSQKCEDVDECTVDPPVCSQLCFNLEGSYRCDCFEGFIPRADKKSCKAVGTPVSLLYTNENQIRELSVRDRSLKLLYGEDTPTITGLAASSSTDTVFFTIESAGTLHQLNKKTMKTQFFKDLGSPQLIALDWGTNNVYFVDGQSFDKSISVCNFESRKSARLIEIKMHSQVSALAVDAVNKVLFYSEVNWYMYNAPSTTVYKANLDGTNIFELVKKAEGHVTGISYDLNKKYVYFVDQHNGQISRVNYDGSLLTTIIGNLTRPVGMDFFEDHIYTFTGSSYLTQCQLYDKIECVTFKLTPHSHALFVAMQESKQPYLENACTNHECPHMCVSSKFSYQCVCQNGKPASFDGICESKEAMMGGENNILVGAALPSLEETPANHTAVAVIIPLSILIIGVALFLYIRKRKTGSLNISMRFHNPGYGLHSDDSDNKAILQPGLHEYSNPIDFDEDDMKSQTSSLHVNA